MECVPQRQIDLLSRNLRRLWAQARLKQEPLAEASLAVLIRLYRALACRWDILLEGIE